MRVSLKKKGSYPSANNAPLSCRGHSPSPTASLLHRPGKGSATIAPDRPPGALPAPRAARCPRGGGGDAHRAEDDNRHRGDNSRLRAEDDNRHRGITAGSEDDNRLRGNSPVPQPGPGPAEVRASPRASLRRLRAWTSVFDVGNETVQAGRPRRGTRPRGI